MKKKLDQEASGSPPSVFHRNNTCSEYFLGEVEFVQNNIFTSTHKKHLSDRAQKHAESLADPNKPEVFKLSPSLYFENRIAESMTLAENGGFADDVALHVIKAVSRFGVDALRLSAHDYFQIHPLTPDEIDARSAETNKLGMALLAASSQTVPGTAPAEKKQTGKPTIQIKRLTMHDGSRDDPDFAEDTSPEPGDKPVRRDPVDYLHPDARAAKEADLEELRHREGLGHLICMVLRFWREQAQHGPLKQRQVAVKHMRQFSKALIPATRGKREKTLTASPYEVKTFYLKELYRLYHVEHCLKSPDGPRNHALRVKEVSKNFQMPVLLIREFWCLDEDDSPNGNRSISIREMARLVTGKQFKVTQHRISNLLSF
ncbi:MAG: hypothetical protein Q8R76_03245 [Candidatus Omnitrophota bacterium]|nr:hypothetical protein [Candidatus Omnitrophota bacterium]MDZ4342592.1 hypothetical protein [Candidatus Binatia bacterium]